MFGTDIERGPDPGRPVALEARFVAPEAENRPQARTEPAEDTLATPDDEIDSIPTGRPVTPPAPPPVAEETPAPAVTDPTVPPVPAPPPPVMVAETLAQPAEPPAREQEPGPSQVISEPLRRALDEMGRQLSEAHQKQQEKTLVVRSIEGSTVALSVGYLSWALRSGALMASFAASMPAWRGFDPLPILSVDRDDEGEKEQDNEEEVDALFKSKTA